MSFEEWEVLTDLCLSTLSRIVAMFDLPLCIRSFACLGLLPCKDERRFKGDDVICSGDVSSASGRFSSSSLMDGRGREGPMSVSKHSYPSRRLNVRSC